MVENYYNALEVEKEMMWLDIEKSRFAAYDYLGRSPEKLMGWFDKQLSQCGEQNYDKANFNKLL